MKLFMQGKDVVLAFLEKSAEARSGEQGTYALLTDDNGLLTHAIIAGHTFSADFRLSDQQHGPSLTVINGVVVGVR